jgi:hypothetical protein
MSTSNVMKKKPINYYVTNVRRYDSSWLSGSVEFFADLPDVLIQKERFWYVQNDS